MNHHGAVESSSDEVLQRGWLRRAFPITAKPPVLMAAILPWDRVNEIGTEKWDWVVVEGMVRAIASAVVGDQGGRAVTMREANASLVREWMALSDEWSYREYFSHAHMRHLSDNQTIANSMDLTLFNWIGKFRMDKGQLIANMNLMEKKIRNSVGVLHFKQWDPGEQREEGSNKGRDLFIKEVKSICSIAGSI
ncbi:hypothetical protein PIB30_036220 [Stylosanthes scabra]|uniref:Uncharacterized protein n=1 Tax=Stylosanthes scabra TaxID=79078 RepID=A0ABU6UC44_9FABA|nr:hypothetical protein [Stylosanthes scabra]